MKQTFMNMETSLRDLISSRLDASDVHTQGSSNLSEIAISMISLNPDQPRKDFDEAELNELAESIRETGIITPVTLRQTGENEYQIIAGERRWRAAQLAGLTTIPAYIWTAENEK
jgi:ParB family chromosome partitioning protein